jgi:hypothetical protein
MRTRSMMLTDEQVYQAQRAALGLSPDTDCHHEKLHSLLEPKKAPMSYAEQKIVAEVRREWEERQEIERLMEIAYKRNKIQHYL